MNIVEIPMIEPQEVIKQTDSGSGGSVRGETREHAQTAIEGQV